MRQSAFNMRTHRRLQRILTGISFVGLAPGFPILGLMIVAKVHDGGVSIIELVQTQLIERK